MMLQKNLNPQDLYKIRFNNKFYFEYNLQDKLHIFRKLLSFIYKTKIWTRKKRSKALLLLDGYCQWFKIRY